MVKVKASAKTPGEIAEEANIKSDISLGLDKEERSSKIVETIRNEEGISLSKEISILRKTLKIVCDSIGIKNEAFENYNDSIEKAKEKADETETKGLDSSL